VSIIHTLKKPVLATSTNSIISNILTAGTRNHIPENIQKAALLTLTATLMFQEYTTTVFICKKGRLER